MRNFGHFSCPLFFSYYILRGADLTMGDSMQGSLNIKDRERERD
jgi:hypothetical protein